MRLVVASLILAVCLIPEWRRWNWLIHEKPPSEIALLEQRLEPIRDKLPRRIGFVSDHDVGRRQMLLNYVLAPRLVESGTQPALILGWQEPPPRLRVVEDLGGGLFLLEKRP